jgi:hypothetical protein
VIYNLEIKRQMKREEEKKETGVNSASVLTLISEERDPTSCKYQHSLVTQLEKLDRTKAYKLTSRILCRGILLHIIYLFC